MMHKYPKLTIGVDCDDTILDLANIWASVYNEEFDDNLTKEQWTDWDVGKFVKSEAKERMYEYIQHPDLFYGAKPIDGALDAINYLKSKGHRIIYITALNYENCKEWWLEKHGFMNDIKDFVQAYDKSLLNCDLLIDDKYENSRDFKQTSFLMEQPWNRKYTDHPEIFRVKNWEHFIEVFDRMSLI